MLLAVGEEASRVEGELGGETVVVGGFRAAGELGKEAEGVGGVRLGRVGEEFL